MVAIVLAELQTSLKVMQTYLPGVLWPAWLQLKYNLSTLKPYNYSTQGLGHVFLLCVLVMVPIVPTEKQI